MLWAYFDSLTAGGLEKWLANPGGGQKITTQPTPFAGIKQCGKV